MTPVSERERKLLDLQRRMALAKAKNVSDVRDESQRLNNPNPAAKAKGRGEVFVGADGETVAHRKPKHADGDGAGARDEDDGEVRALSKKSKGAAGKGGSGDEDVAPELRYLDATVGDCDDYAAKVAKKQARAAAEGWAVHAMENKYKTHEKRSSNLPQTKNTNAPAGSTSAINYKPTDAQLNNFVEEIDKQEKIRMEKRRKRHLEGKDATYISDDNKRFAEKAAKHYDKYTAEVANALERGSA